MSINVTLNIFSGRPNPTWQLTDSQALELRERLDAIRGTSFDKPAGALGGLGYTGFTLAATQEDNIEPEIFVHDDVVDLGPQNVSLRGANRELENWLIASGGDAVEPVARRHVDDLIRPVAYAGRAMRARSLEVPRFEPHVWNTNPQTMRDNNCYNYASNLMTNTFAQPGRASGFTPPSISVADYLRAVASDGLEVLADPNAPQRTPIDGHFMALVIWPSADFHFYRLDDFTARWSHKPGQTMARDTDQSGSQISDPRSCDRGPYSDFGSYLYIVPSRVTIR
ncbi:MAG TPA: hypothetical protein VKB80_27515 [Kofleriaceae bacterium]|nr:hypothetical protein [Kofleriaceae bacterium]